MRNTALLALIALMVASCATPYYSGTVTYYLPDGTTETYRAVQDANWDSKPVGNVRVVFGPGNQKVTKDIPWKFDGTLVKGKTKVTENQRVRPHTYNGVTYDIPVWVWEDAYDYSMAFEGRVVKSRVDEYLARYIRDHHPRVSVKYRDEVYTR